MSECDRYLEMISQLVDGELPEPQKTELLAHLDGCANCRRVYDAFSAISLSLGETAAPEGFAEGVMAAVRTQGGHGSRRAKKPGKSQVRYMALAACIVLALSLIHICFSFQRPPEVAVVYHLPGHAAVDADVLAGDEARLVRAEVEHHVRDVHRVPHAARGLLTGVRALIDCVVRVYPAGGDGIHAHPPSEAHRERVGECGDAALGRSIALRLRLAHPVARGGDVHDGRPWCEVGREQLCKIERRRDAHAQSVVELLVGAAVEALHERQGVVDEVVHMPDVYKRQVFISSTGYCNSLCRGAKARVFALCDLVTVRPRRMWYALST